MLQPSKIISTSASRWKPGCRDTGRYRAREGPFRRGGPGSDYPGWPHHNSASSFGAASGTQHRPRVRRWDARPAQESRSPVPKLHLADEVKGGKSAGLNRDHASAGAVAFFGLTAANFAPRAAFPGETTSITSSWLSVPRSRSAAAAASIARQFAFTKPRDAKKQYFSIRLYSDVFELGET